MSRKKLKVEVEENEERKQGCKENDNKAVKTREKGESWRRENGRQTEEERMRLSVGECFFSTISTVFE